MLKLMDKKVFAILFLNSFHFLGLGDRIHHEHIMKLNLIEVLKKNKNSKLKLPDFKKD